MHKCARREGSVQERRQSHRIKVNRLRAPGGGCLYGRRWLGTFGLDPMVLHVNHGSFGAVPDPIREVQRRIQDEMRADPSRYFRSEYPDRIREAAGSVAAFLGGAQEDWVFVENATSAANAVLSSLRLGSGDRILFTSQIYGAVRKAVLYWCDRTGARPVEAVLPPPLRGAGQVAEAVVSAACVRTRLVILDHVTAACGIVFPVRDLCTHFRDRGVPVFVDGAHVPGNLTVDGAHVPGNLTVDVPALGADFYAANAHKWLCTPPGAGVLWCRRAHQERMRPTVISHGCGSGFTQAFDWTGTRDPSAWLSVPAAIEFHNAAGAAALRERNRMTAFTAATRLAAQFGTELAAPEAMHCSMASVRLPVAEAQVHSSIEWLQVEIATRAKASVSLSFSGDALWLRLSAAIYNDVDDLVEAGHRVMRVLGDINGLQ